MTRKTDRERYLIQFGLELSLLSTGDGWSYSWINPNTRRTVVWGWTRGNKREGEQEAT